MSHSHSRAIEIYLNFQILHSPFHWPCSIPVPGMELITVTRLSSVRQTAGYKTLFSVVSISPPPSDGEMLRDP